MKWLIASAGVFVVACGLSVSSTGDGVGDAGGSDAGSGAADGSPSNNDGGALADAGEDAPLPPPASCLDIKTRSPSAPSGRYTITLPNRGDVAVHCEMTLLGGGFTLVGRSTTGSVTSASFGWTSQTGTIDNEAPYSLDARGLSFTKALITDWGVSGASTVGVLLELPPDFLTANATTAVDVRPLQKTSVTIFGGCVGGDFLDSQQMIRWLGHTTETDQFFIRDNGDVLNFGLFSNGYNLSTALCARSLGLHNKRGAIFVR